MADTKPVTDADIAADYYKIVTAIVGPNLHGSLVELTSGPMSLYNAAYAFEDSWREFKEAQNTLRAVDKSMRDVWTGAAADMFKTLMKDLDIALEINLRPLDGPRSYTERLISAGDELYVATVNIQSIDHFGATWTATYYNELLKRYNYAFIGGRLPPLEKNRRVKIYHEYQSFLGMVPSSAAPKTPWVWGPNGQVARYTPEVYPNLYNEMTERAALALQALVRVYNEVMVDMAPPGEVRVPGALGPGNANRPGGPNLPKDTDGDGYPDVIDDYPDDPTRAVSKPPPQNLPKDTDGDGYPDVIDEFDDDPDRAVAPPPSQKLPKDTDGDGFPDVTDEFDDDPDRAFAPPPSSQNLPKDSDGDGFPDVTDEFDDDPDRAFAPPPSQNLPKDSDGDGFPDVTDEFDDDSSKAFAPPEMPPPPALSESPPFLTSGLGPFPGPLPPLPGSSFAPPLPERQQPQSPVIPQFPLDGSVDLPDGTDTSPLVPPVGPVGPPQVPRLPAAPPLATDFPYTSQLPADIRRASALNDSLTIPGVSGAVSSAVGGPNVYDALHTSVGSPGVAPLAGIPALSATGLGLAGAGQFGPGGMPFMPMCPPMGGAAHDKANEERERATWLLEDRPIWSTGVEVAPGVVRSGVKRGDEDSSTIEEPGVAEGVSVAAAGPSQRPHATREART